MDVTVIGGVLAVATMFGQVIVRTKLPQALVNLIVAHVDSRTVFIILVVMLIVFLGMLMDGAVITVIVTPMLRLAKAMVPWMVALLLFTLTMAYFPGFVTWLLTLFGFA